MKNKIKPFRAKSVSMFALILVALFSLSACSSPLPKGKAGPEAEALANKLLTAMNQVAWSEKTAAVEWVFADQNRHFWDKGRGLIEVQFDETLVQFKNDWSKSMVWEDGKRVTGTEASELVKKAYGYFINDAFWLNPAAHLRSPGAVRKITKDGKLLVTFTSGGVTPGDSYLFTLDEKNRIKVMNMWTSVIPIGGARAEFSDYVTSATGVTIAAKHKVLGLLSVDLSAIKMYGQYPPAGGKDRFAELLK